jgi:uracil-DNA glycosylase family 4
VAGFRVQLESRGRSGLLGVPAAAGRPIQQDRRPPPNLPRAQGVGEEPVRAEGGAGAGRSSDLDGRPTGAVGLQLTREELGDCQRCRLKDGRQQIVFGVGNPDAELVFVGEGPGADEDRTGEPFVGAAGQLLTKMIEAMGFRREDVYICNVIKCRPPGNRNPEPDEVAACEPFLKKQLAALRPRMIVTLGKFAAHCLLRIDTPITRLRGNFKSYEGVQLMPTYHPAFLLRDPSRKREAWSDLQSVVSALRRMGVEPPLPTRA